MGNFEYTRRMKVVAVFCIAILAFAAAEQRALLSTRSNRTVPNNVQPHEILPASLHGELSSSRVSSMAAALDQQKEALVNQYNYIKGLKNNYDNDAKIYKENTEFFNTMRDNVATNIADHATNVAAIAPSGLPFEAAAGSPA